MDQLGLELGQAVPAPGPGSEIGRVVLGVGPHAQQRAEAGRVAVGDVTKLRLEGVLEAVERLGPRVVPHDLQDPCPLVRLLLDGLAHPALEDVVQQVVGRVEG